MFIPQTNRGYGYQSMISYVGNSDKEQVRRDILHRIVILDAQRRPVDKTGLKELVDEVILPAFEDLYKRWPDAYKLLARTSMPIAIVKSPSYVFKPRTTADARRSNGGQQVASGVTISTYPNNASIFLNLADNFTNEQLKMTAYHEIMHAVSQFAVKDAFCAKKKKGEVRILSRYLDKHFNGKLSRLAKSYMERADTAIKQINDWISANRSKYKSENEFWKACYNTYEYFMSANKCWGARRQEFGDCDSLKEIITKGVHMPDSEEEFLVDGLMAYFGDEGNVKDNLKKRLMEQEFGLYDMIENIVLPAIKKAPMAEEAMDKYIEDLVKKQHQK